MLHDSPAAEERQCLGFLGEGGEEPGMLCGILNQMDGVSRFLGRADDYAAARPGYPAPLLPYLREKAGLEPGARVADVGSGTGILTRLILRSGAVVYGVEPNPDMRSVAEADFAEEPLFVSLDGSAEEMPFDDGGLDLIVCGQSFHWFDQAKAREEFQRTLHGVGWVLVLWNSLDDSAGGAAEAVHQILKEAEGGKLPELSRNNRKDLRSWYGSKTYEAKVMKHSQTLQIEDIIPYARSRSYWPEPQSDSAKELEAKLLSVAEEFSNGGTVTLKLTCEIHLGQLG